MARQNNIMFRNIRVEMARQNLTINKMSKLIQISRTTLSEKLSGKRKINLNEALCIARKCFPECDLYYLFEELLDDTTNTEKQTTETVIQVS